MTRREAHCILGLLASGGSYTTTGALSVVLDVPQESVKATLHGVQHKLSQDRSPSAWMRHDRGYGWLLYGKASKLDEMYREALSIIADDAAKIAADRIAGERIPRLPMVRTGAVAFATPSAMVGMGR